MEPGRRKAARRANGQIAPSAGSRFLLRDSATLCHRFPAKAWRGAACSAWRRPRRLWEPQAAPLSGPIAPAPLARAAAFCPARKLHHYRCIRNNSGSTALGWNTDSQKQHMKIARMNRHIARPVLAPGKRLRIESNRWRVIYFLYRGGLEPRRYPYID